jgi:hypothetical protein
MNFSLVNVAKEKSLDFYSFHPCSSPTYMHIQIITRFSQIMFFQLVSHIYIYIYIIDKNEIYNFYNCVQINGERRKILNAHFFLYAS